MYGKCPQCQQLVNYVNIEPINGKVSGGNEFHCVSYKCPNLQCNTVLGVQIDPVALKNDIVNEIGKKFGR